MAITLPFTRSHAFVIGINDYAHITPLKTAVNDAKGIAQRLEAQHGYEVHGPLLNPGKADLEKLFFQTMPQEVGEEDRVVFYFAGHGIALDGDHGPNGYIVPADAKQGDRESLIPMDELHKTLNALPCRHGLLILDCCFSGAFKWSTGHRDVVFDLPKVIYEERFWRYVKDPAWQVITSAAYDQKAVDVISDQSIGLREEGDGQHSPFARGLFEAIEGRADVIPADQADGVITASELYAYLRDSVERQTASQSKQQSPSMFNLSRHDKGEFIFLNPKHPFNLPPTPDRNPFMGPAPYGEEDSHFLFGRKRALDELSEHILTHPLTVLTGASGSGKSSIMKAGLPQALLTHSSSPFDRVMSFSSDEQSLQEFISQVTEEFQVGNRLAIVLDDYGKLIKMLGETEQQDLRQVLAKWRQDNSEFRLILSCAIEEKISVYEDSLSAFAPIGRYKIAAPTTEEIRQIIAQPVAQSVLFYEPAELSERIQDEIQHAPGALAWLSSVLDRLYRAYHDGGRSDRALTEEDYDAFGGIQGLLQEVAEGLYLSLEEKHQTCIRKLMTRIIIIEAGEIQSKRIYEEDLIFSNEETSQRMKHVAGLLVEKRVLVRDRDSQGRIFYDSAHPQLVEAWTRLSDWIQTIGDNKLIANHKLALAVKDYQELLEGVGERKARGRLWYNEQRADYFFTEIQEEQHELNAREEQFIRKSIQRKKAIRKNRNRWIGAAFIALSALTGWAFFERSVAQFESTRNSSWFQASEAINHFRSEDITKAINWAWNAYETQANDNTSAALIEITQKKPQDLFIREEFEHGLSYAEEVKFSYDGTYFLVHDEDSVVVWQTEPRSLLFKRHISDLIGTYELYSEDKTGIAFSPDGQWLIAIDHEEAVKRAWTLPSGDSVHLDAWTVPALAAIAYAHDIKPVGEDYWILLSGEWSPHRYGIFSLNHLKTFFQSDEGDINDLFERGDTAFLYGEFKQLQLKGEDYISPVISPDLKNIFAGEAGGMNLKLAKFEISTGKLLAESDEMPTSVERIIYPKGSKYITVLDEGDIFLWDNKLDKLYSSYHTRFADYLSPDGRFAYEVNPGNDSTLNKWEIPDEEWSIPVIDVSHRRKTNQFAYWTGLSPQGNFLGYTVDDSVWLRSLNPLGNPVFLSKKQRTSEACYITFSHDETLLLERKLSSRINSHVLYEVPSGKKLCEIDTSLSMTISADGTYLISSEKDGWLYKREIPTGNIQEKWVDLGADFGLIVASMDGRFLAACIDSVAIIYNIETNKIIPLKRDYESLAFSQDGEFLLAADLGVVQVLKSIDGERVQSFRNGASQTPRNLTGMRLQMLTIEDNRYLLTGNGIFDIQTGLQVESFEAPYKQNHSTHVVIDPQGKFQLRSFKGIHVLKTPIVTQDWLNGNIHRDSFLLEGQ